VACPSPDEAGVEVASGVTPTCAAVLQQIALALHTMAQLLFKHGTSYPQLAEMPKGVFAKVAQLTPSWTRDVGPMANWR
jgi:hypothetical protein